MIHIGDISEEERLSLLDIVSNRPYRHIIDDGNFFCQRYAQVGRFFARVVKLEPRGWLHPHTDDCNHTHVVLLTNDMAVCYVNHRPHFLKERGIYEFDARQVHHATNEGETDRIHLIL